MIVYFLFLSMICCNSALEQGNLDLWRYINAFIIIIGGQLGRDVVQGVWCLTQVYVMRLVL